MKYKTLFRLMLKVLGVYIFFLGLSELLSTLFYILPSGFSSRSVFSGGSIFAWFFGLISLVVQPGFKILVGAYLFFDGKWIVDKAIPSNRPYCPDCAYELTGVVSGRCPECGCPIDPKLLSPASLDQQ